MIDRDILGLILTLLIMNQIFPKYIVDIAIIFGIITLMQACY